MNETIDFLIKIFIASLILSLLIKYLGPLLSLAPSNLNALIIVMIVPVIVTVFLTKKMLNTPSDS
ncbi:MAG: hypothetical protein QNJ42_06535 [Crocosphaera sp.]|nr:hypothetical protein [Crocosphaera sp.]